MMKALYSVWSKLKIFWITTSLIVLSAYLFNSLRSSTQLSSWWVYETQAPITGHQAFSIPTRNPISIDKKQTYINDYHGHIYALDKHTGKLLWTFTTNNYSPYPPTTSDEQQLYIADFDSRIYALDKKNGTELWRFVIPNLIQPDTPVYTTTNHVVFGARNGILYALNKKTGALDWQHQVGTPSLYIQNSGENIIHFGMMTTTKDTIVINTPYKSLVVLRENDGSIIQKIPLLSYTQESPVLVRDVAFIKDGNVRIIAIDLVFGEVVWEKLLSVPIKGSMHFSEDTMTYLDEQHTLHELEIASGDETATVILTKTQAECPLDYTLPLVMYAQPARIIIGAGATLCSFSIEDGAHKWSQTIQGDIRSIEKIRDDAVLIFSEKKDTTVLSVISNDSGSIIDWVNTVNIHPYSLLRENNTYYFISRDERKILSVQTPFGSPYLHLELFKQCCRLGFPMPIPKLYQWNQTPITINAVSWQKKIYQRIRRLFDTSIAVQTTIQKDISPILYELTFIKNDSIFANPFLDITIAVAFSDDKNQPINIQGFYADKNTWKVRFSPPHEGRWRWDAHIYFGIHSLTKKGEFTFKQSEKNSGYIQATPLRQYLFTPDDHPFIGIGLQDTMQDYNFDGNPINQWGSMDNDPLETKVFKFTDMDTYFSTYRSNTKGFSLYRFGVDNSSFRLWKTISPKGNRYAVNEGVWADQVLSTLRKNKYRVMMSIFGFEPPITQVDEETKRRALEKYLDYIVGRYAAYVDIWELTNESVASKAWISFVSGYIRSIDPYHHPITTNWQRPELDEIEINSIHWYDNEKRQTIDTATASIVSNASFWNKPVIISEQGNRDVSWSADSALRLRVKLWISTMNNTSIIFWNQTRGRYLNADNANIYLGKTELEYVRSLNTIIGNTHQDGTLKHTQSSNPLVRIYTQINSKSMIIYAYNSSDTNTRTHSSVSIDVPVTGTATWYNPSNGNILGSIRIMKGTRDIIIPAFSEDIVLKIE